MLARVRRSRRTIDDLDGPSVTRNDGSCCSAKSAAAWAWNRATVVVLIDIRPRHADQCCGNDEPVACKRVRNSVGARMALSEEEGGEDSEERNDPEHDVL
jgi:hypothetical protein